MTTTTTTPEIPTDLPGWAWETSPVGAIRLTLGSEGWATKWAPPTAPGLAADEAREITARDAALAAEEAPPPPIRKGQALRLSSGATTTLPHGLIRTDGGTQPRAGLDAEHVARLREALIAGATLPALAVFHDGEAYWLADGFHRLAAWRETLAAGGVGAKEYIACQVQQGTRRDAVLYSTGANRAHGLPRSRDDLQRAIETLLRDEEWRRWSDREIARRIGCSDKTVGARRKVLEATADIPQSETRTSADGRERPATRPVSIASPEPVEAPPSDDPGDDLDDLIADTTAIESRIRAGIAGDDDRRALRQICARADELGAVALGTRADDLRTSLGPRALPAGWQWRDDIPPNPNDSRKLWQARREADGLTARADHDQDTAAEHAAWSERRNPLPEEAAPLPPDFTHWVDRAHAAGCGLDRRDDGIYELIEPDGQRSGYPQWLGCIARVRAFEMGDARTGDAPAETPTPAASARAASSRETERNYEAFEQLLAALLERLSPAERMALAAVALPDEDLDGGALLDPSEALWERWTVAARARPAYVAEALKAGREG